MIIEPAAPRTCGGCEHWQINNMKTAKAGYAEATCFKPFKQTQINLEYPVTRASDTCSGWTVRKPPPEPVPIDPWGYGY